MIKLVIGSSTAGDAGGYNKGKPSPIVTFKEAHTFGEFVVIPSYNFVGGSDLCQGSVLG